MWDCIWTREKPRSGDQKKTEKDTISNFGVFPRLGPAAQFTCLWGGEPALGSVASSEARLWSVGESNPLPGGQWEEGKELLQGQKTLLAPTSQRPFAGWAEWHYPGTRVCGAGSFKTLGFASQHLGGMGDCGVELMGLLMLAQHCEDGLNRVVWVTQSEEERLGCHHFSSHHQQSGASGTDRGLAVEAEPACTKPHPSMPGNWVSTRARLILTSPGGPSSRPAQPPVPRHHQISVQWFCIF